MTSSLKARSDINVPLLAVDDKLNLRGSELSQAQQTPAVVSETGTPSTSKNLVPGGNLIADLINAAFTNCIFWGEEGQVKDEIIVSKQGNDPFAATFTNCLYRASAEPSNSIFIACIQNEQPQFDSIDASKKIFDFHINNFI